jgi:hypothetical protein
MTMPGLSILDGVDAIFDRWLAVAPIGKLPTALAPAGRAGAVGGPLGPVGIAAPSRCMH